MPTGSACWWPPENASAFPASLHLWIGIRNPGCRTTTPFLFIDACLYITISTLTRHAIRRFAPPPDNDPDQGCRQGWRREMFRRWRDVLPYWSASIGCAIFVSLLMSAAHRRWPDIEIPPRIVTVFIAVHVFILRFFGGGIPKALPPCVTAEPFSGPSARL